MTCRDLTWVRRVVAAAALCGVVMLSGTGSACDTPVYRYAMYRWQPAPYELYCFSDGELDAASQLVLSAVERAGAPACANLMSFLVNVQDEKALAGLPADIQEAWIRQSPKQTPWFLLSSPVGVHMLAGAMTENDVPALVDSPARRAIGQLLEEGKAGVYVLVTNDDPTATEAAEKEIRGVIDDVKAGVIEIYSGPMTSAEDSESPHAAVEFDMVKLARDDAHERWLLDCLLNLAPDLHDNPEPMAFLVYGRGRAIFSSLGKGIHRDNLTMDVEFITGACSCTVKEQNPGVDLLMSYNWDAVAEALARQYGAEEGNPYHFSGDELFPELMIPPESAPPATTDPALAAALPPDIAASTVTTAAAHAQSTPPETDAAEPISPPSSQQPAAPTVEPAADPLPAANAVPEAPAIGPWRGVLWVGGGLLGALVVLFGATFLVLRPR